ncbi:DUF2384 domain-containing protein [Bradyrhizobium sp. AUGA SZCCT0182]|nr:DUF2384 domain-containing protein [Bradyrhizobium sp. AUGA SZCCT0182]
MPLNNEVIPFAPRPRSQQGQAYPLQERASALAGNLLTTNAQLGNTALGLSRLVSIDQAAPPIANPRVRRGAIEGFVRTCERWRLDSRKQVILLGYPGNELAAQPILMGRVRPSQDALDRTGYVLSISIGLSAIYNDSVGAELDWLSRPHSALGQVAPLDFMLDGRMPSMMRVNDLVSTERGL